MYDRMKFGERVRQLRIQNEYTQEGLAEKLGIDANFLDDIEAGKKECPVELVAQLSVTFGVSIHMLVLGKEHESSLNGSDHSQMKVEITELIAQLEELKGKL